MALAQIDGDGDGLRDGTAMAPFAPKRTDETYLAAYTNGFVDGLARASDCPREWLSDDEWQSYVPEGHLAFSLEHGYVYTA